MPVAWADVAALDAPLANVPSAAQTAILADVALMLDVDRWGTRLDLATKYLAAHVGALVLRGGGAAGVGPVTSQTMGPASKSYATPMLLAALGDLGATVWGQIFARLRTSLGVFGIVG